MIHYIKTWPPYFAAVVSGEKTFEIRKDDRNFSVSDKLILQEYDPATRLLSGKETVRIITYKYSGPGFGVEAGYCVLGLGHPMHNEEASMMLIKDMIALLSPEEQEACHELAEHMRRQISAAGISGELALALVGAEQEAKE